MNLETNDEIEIDLRKLFLVLWNRIWIIALAGIATAILAYEYTYFNVTPLYRSDVTLYVNNININSDATGFSSTQLQAVQGLASTYMVILESRSVMEAVAQRTGLPYTTAQLQSMVSASSVDDTEVFRVNVVNPDPETAATIANAIANILPGKISQIVEGSSVRVVDYAKAATSPSSPNYKKNTMIGLMIGVAISVGLIVLLELLNESITSEEYLTRVYPNIPLLAVIPDSMSSRGSKYYKHYKTEESKKGKKNQEEDETE